MATNAPLVDLAKDLLQAAEHITSYLQANNLPQPSLAVGGHDLPPTPEIAAARRTLQEASKTLSQLAVPRTEHLRYIVCSFNDLAAFRHISHYKLYNIVPRDGDISYDDLAAKAGANARQTKRLLRLAMTNGVFIEPRTGYVAHNAESLLLVDDKSARGAYGYCVEEVYPASAKVYEVSQQFPDSEEPNHTGYNLAFDTDLPYFQHAAQNPAQIGRFADGMGSMASDPGFSSTHVVNGFDWDSLGKGKVVDVGGGIGHIDMAIAAARPSLSFVVQDLPANAEIGRTTLPKDLQDRISYEPHDFFQQQTVGADVYLLRFILHDWPDKWAAKILQGIIPAMAKGSRIVVVDGIMPPPGVVPPSMERKMRLMDVHMTIMHNALERELEDWKALFTRADERLRLVSVRTPEGSAQSIMVLELADDAAGAQA